VGLNAEMELLEIVNKGERYGLPGAVGKKLESLLLLFVDVGRRGQKGGLPGESRKGEAVV
jgi:hypothetical protein